MAINLPPQDFPMPNLNLPLVDSVNDLKNPILETPAPRELLEKKYLSPGATLVENGVQIDGYAGDVPDENIQPKLKRRKKRTGHET
ncbi:uncharacterized protein Z518_07158 [Rhinocladiella mackenziei CBS 650.93]|uniref:Uncharacterized protein n=1 Tax=Rhinocladiella mackenziei CBS 650.93 TaxID=1442369 RepID=A0A0D2J3Q3_9EURO|nr:uncharacterized protein Z518_07158 [Rhinocladiella mackenziei CBS 650.93]KIX03605.1 hypothetical protein Z518_07158 [Rhinocladiella mackenziei CBS 650.93]